MIYTILNDAMLLLAKKPMTAEGVRGLQQHLPLSRGMPVDAEKGFVDRK